MTKDFDAAKRARLEKLGDPVTFAFGGREYELPLELPYAFAEHIAIGDLRSCMQVVLGNDAKAFFESEPSIDDMTEICNWIALERVGADLGESEGSPSSSRPAGKSSKPASSGATTSS